MKEKALRHLSKFPEAKMLVEKIEKKIIDQNVIKRFGNELIKVIMLEATKAYKEGRNSDFFD